MFNKSNLLDIKLAAILKQKHTGFDYLVNKLVQIQWPCILIILSMKFSSHGGCPSSVAKNVVKQDGLQGISFLFID